MPGTLHARKELVRPTVLIEEHYVHLSYLWDQILSFALTRKKDIQGAQYLFIEAL